ncbi:MAG: sigma-70 family RNA polymerase sigma factor [Lentimicrobium sp.]|nr:sigma-70 family RNA polymerase sigma factor [Lentimicrobium sp.]
MTRAEYNKCVDHYADGVYRFILKNIKDTERARDIVQDSFSKMWEKVGDINTEKAKSYLFTTAYHTMIDEIRHEKAKTSFNENIYDNLTVNHSWNDLKEVLQKALDTLPLLQKTVIMLRDYEGYSYEEIGNITNLSDSQVKVYIYRGRVALKNFIGSMDKVI